MSLSIKLEVEPVRSLGFASIAAGYIGVGTSISNPARMLLMQNFTNANLMFSFNGIDDHIPLISYSYLILDISSNKNTDGGFFLAEGERLYVKQMDVPTSGSVYLTVFYGED